MSAIENFRKTLTVSQRIDFGVVRAEEHIEFLKEVTFLLRSKAASDEHERLSDAPRSTRNGYREVLPSEWATWLESMLPSATKYTDSEASDGT